MLLDFLAHGYSEALFWSLTPRQIDNHLRAVGRRLRREHNERMTLAYHIAALPTQKKAVRLKDLLVDVDDDRPRKAQGWEEIKAALILALDAKPETDE